MFFFLVLAKQGDSYTLETDYDAVAEMDLENFDTFGFLCVQVAAITTTDRVQLRSMTAQGSIHGRPNSLAHSYSDRFRTVLFSQSPIGS